MEFCFVLRKDFSDQPDLEPVILLSSHVLGLERVCIATPSKVYNRFHVTAVFPIGQYDLWDKDQGRSFYLGSQHSAI